MALSAEELLHAKDTVGRLLEQLGLKAYLFEVEPLGEAWQVRLECATSDGWQTVHLQIAAPLLRDCDADGAVRSEILHHWGKRLAACQRG